MTSCDISTKHDYDQKHLHLKSLLKHGEDAKPLATRQCESTLCWPSTQLKFSQG